MASSQGSAECPSIFSHDLRPLISSASTMSPLLLTVVLPFSAFFVLRWLYARRLRLQRVPPGPRGWPLLENIFDIPTDYAWLKYADMAKKHGERPVCSFSATSQAFFRRHDVLRSLRSTNAYPQLSPALYRYHGQALRRSIG